MKKNVPAIASAPMKPRSFQTELAARAARIARKALSTSKTVAHVTPGSGKTFGASVFANVMVEAGLVDAILYLAPRRSLKKQVAEEFARPRDSFTTSDGKSIKLTTRIEESKNGPGRKLGQIGTDKSVVRGYVTTYQDVVANPERWLAFVQRHRTLLIADEVHHVATNPSRESGDDAAFHKKCTPLFMAAQHRLLLSGTLERHNDRERISWIDYDDITGLPMVDVDYRRSDALRERAIHPVVFFKQDAHVEWETDGKTISGEMSQFRGRKERHAVRAALKTEFRKDVVDKFLADLLDVKRQYRKAKAVIVCDDQRGATDVLHYIESSATHRGINCGLAISDEKDAQRNINNFRLRSDEDVLITVSMAHEGLDVPEVTHMLYLSRVRSSPYFAQAIARAQRLRRDADPAWPYDARFARVYVPQDSAMAGLIDRIVGDQRQALGETYESKILGNKKVPRSRFTPVSSSVTDEIIQSEGNKFSAEDMDTIRQVENMYPEFVHHSPEWKLDFAVKTMVFAERLAKKAI